MSLGTGASYVGRGPEYFRPLWGGKVLEERRYPHTKGGAMGKYPQALQDDKKKCDDIQVPKQKGHRGLTALENLLIKWIA